MTKPTSSSSADGEDYDEAKDSGAKLAEVVRKHGEKSDEAWEAVKEHTRKKKE